MKVPLQIVISLICGATIVYTVAALGEVRFWHVLYWSLPFFPKTHHATGPNMQATGYCLLVDVILIEGLIFSLLPRRRS